LVEIVVENLVEIVVVAVEYMPETVVAVVVENLVEM
jgi:hypothetical protein